MKKMKAFVKKEKVLSALIAFQLVAGQGTWMYPVVHAEDAPAEESVVHEGDKKGSAVVGGDYNENGTSVSDDKKNSATGISSAVIAGYDNHAEGDNSVAIGGSGSDAKGSNSVVGLGGKTTGGDFDFVFGEGNVSSGDHTTILGGFGNSISTETKFGGGYYNQIFGGHNNLISTEKWPGWGDSAGGYQMGHNTIINGLENKILNGADLSTIIGGKENTINQVCTNCTAASAIIGGEKNTVETFGDGSYILGGVSNKVTGERSSAIAGTGNTVSESDSAILAGSDNTINTSGYRNVILGGGKNSISGYSFPGYPAGAGNNIIAGGYGNSIEGESHGGFGGAGIFGGANNKITASGYTLGGSGSVIIGGVDNIVSTISQAAVVGGESNVASGGRSLVLGGEKNTASNWNSASVGGESNAVSGVDSVILGGEKNNTTKDHSAIIGGNTTLASAKGASIIGSKGTRSGNDTDGWTYTTEASGYYSTIIGGGNQKTSGYQSAVIAGDSNTAKGKYSAVIGGESNSTDGDNSIVLGGKNSNVNGTDSANIAGNGNTNNGLASVIVGGGSVWHDGNSGNTISDNAERSVIAGGRKNVIDGNDILVSGDSNTVSGDSNLVGGYKNTATSYAGFISGGRNTISASWGAIVGGKLNAVEGENSAVVAGRGNTNKGTLSVILGGGNEGDDDKDGNEISEKSERSVIAGGKSNSVNGDDDLVSGESNTVSGDANLVGGSRNKATSSYGFVSGRYNSVGGYGAAAIGGYSNTVNGSYAANIGGYRNQASGAYSVTLGGQGSTASGDNSLASQGGIAYGANSIALGSGSVAYGSDAVAIGTNSINNEAETVSFGRKATDKTYNLEQKWTPYRSKSYTSSDGSYGYSYENYTLRDSDGNAVELSTDGSLQLFKAGNYTLTYDYSSWHIDPATGEKVIDYSNQSTAGGITLGKDMYGSTSLTDNGSGVLQTTNFYTVDESAPTTAITRRLTNVSRGVDDTDAVNVSQLKDAINEAKFDPATGGDDPLNVKYDSLQKTSVTLGGDTGTQIKNVAEGTDGTDAVNLNQLNKAIANINISGGGGNDKNAVHYDGDDHTKVSLTGEGGTTITNVKDGEISDDSTDAINGSQLKAEQDERKDADDKLDKRIGTLDVKTYNYIDASNNVSQNLQALDEAITNGGGDCLVKDNGKTITIAKDSKTSVIDIRGSNQNRVITGVQTNPADGSSAVSVDYLNGRVNDVNNRIDGLEDDMKGIGAGAAALAGLHPLPYDPNNRVSYATSIGSYEGKTAFALGAFYQAKRDLLFSIGGAFSNGTMMNLGVAGRFGKTTEEAYGNGGAGGAGSGGLSPELAAEIQKLRAENASMRAENQKLREENEYVSKKSNWFLGVAHDMYEKMRTMTGREEDWEFVKKDKEKGMDSVK